MLVARTRTRSTPSRTLPEADRDPHWFKRAVFYEVLVRVLPGQQRRRHRRPAGADARSSTTCSGSASTASGCRRSSSRRCATAATTSPTTPTCCRSSATSATSCEFVDAAHERGMRVIIDFVMNHTRDQHPWFQASRTDPDGPYGDFYVWADDDKPYPDARIIFVDTETSNWTFDPVRKQYFWHRFFSHQPDLNYENPAVQEAILAALRFWLDLGIDGFRLDAVPYLFEEEGTNCENLPAHARVPQAGAQGDRRALPGHGAARRGQPVAGGRRRVLRRPGRRRVPHGLPLPGDAAHLHGGPPRVALPDLGDPGPDPGDPGQLPVGHLPAQPRRADPRDGHRRGTRLHVRGVRQGPADEGQHRHPPPARPAARQRPQPDRAVHRAAAVAARLAGPLLRRRDRHGRQHLARRPRRRPHPDAVDARPQRRLLRPATPAGSSCPTIMDPVYGYQVTNVEAPAAHPRPRCCTGPAG